MKRILCRIGVLMVALALSAAMSLSACFLIDNLDLRRAVITFVCVVSLALGMFSVLVADIVSDWRAW